MTVLRSSRRGQNAKDCDKSVCFGIKFVCWLSKYAKRTDLKTSYRHLDIAEAVSKALFMPKSHENFRVLAYFAKYRWQNRD